MIHLRHIYIHIDTDQNTEYIPMNYKTFFVFNFLAIFSEFLATEYYSDAKYNVRLCDNF